MLEKNSQLYAGPWQIVSDCSKTLKDIWETAVGLAPLHHANFSAKHFLVRKGEVPYAIPLTELTHNEHAALDWMETQTISVVKQILVVLNASAPMEAKAIVALIKKLEPLSLLHHELESHYTKYLQSGHNLLKLDEKRERLREEITHITPSKLKIF
jgi:hypothetical protein